MMFQLFIKKYLPIIVLAVLIRMAVMPFYFHPDLKTINFQASFLKQGVFNIYSYLPAHKQELSIKEGFAYFPLTYFFFGGYQILATPVFGEQFNDWLKNPSAQVTESVGVYRYLFLLKIPYLVFDIALAFVLMNFFIDEGQRRKILLLWLLNPFSIALIYLYSNFDVIPAFITMCSLLLAQKRKLALASLLLGLGAGFKVYPLLFFPFLLLYAKSYKQALVMALSCLGTVALILAPFAISSGFKESIFASGITDRIAKSGFSIGYGETILIFPVAFTALLLSALLEKNLKLDTLWKLYLTVLLLLFSFINFHISWILWVMPLFAMVFVYDKKYRIPTTALTMMACSIPLLFNDKYMSVSLLSPISSLYTTLPIPFTILQFIHDPYEIQSVIHSLFAGTSLATIFYLLRQERQL